MKVYFLSKEDQDLISNEQSTGTLIFFNNKNLGVSPPSPSTRTFICLSLFSKIVAISSSAIF